MSTQCYAVYAYSPTLHQEVRRVDLAQIGQTNTEESARQDAEFFAQLQNSQQALMTTDWQPLVKLEEHGYDTIPGFLYTK